MYNYFTLINVETVLTKIKQFQESKRIAHQELITGLPEWENEYDDIHKKKIIY